MVRIGLLASRIRVEEKLLVQAARDRGIELEPLDDRQLIYPLSDAAIGGGSNGKVVDRVNFGAVLERGVSYWHSHYASRALEQYGVPVINRHEVIRRCGDKAETSFLLAAAGVPTPRVILALGADTAREAAERLGYPVVLKPVVGSWGRLVNRARDTEELDALVEHRSVLGGPQHGVFYVQEHVDKPGRDIRAFVVGDEVIAAIYRVNDRHFITNTAQGGRVENCPVTSELRETCLRAAGAMGGGVLALDLMETPDGGLTVHEVNHSMEFRNSIQPTGVDIPGRILEYAVEVAKGAPQ